jgi:hypothetical protein
MEGHAGEIRAELRRRGDDLARVARPRAELAGQRPVGADVRRRDAQVELGVGLGFVHAPQLVDAVDHEPLHALGGRVGDRFA